MNQLNFEVDNNECLYSLKNESTKTSGKRHVLKDFLWCWTYKVDSYTVAIRIHQKKKPKVLKFVSTQKINKKALDKQND